MSIINKLVLYSSFVIALLILLITYSPLITLAVLSIYFLIGKNKIAIQSKICEIINLVLLFVYSNFLIINVLALFQGCLNKEQTKITRFTIIGIWIWIEICIFKYKQIQYLLTPLQKQIQVIFHCAIIIFVLNYTYIGSHLCKGYERQYLQQVQLIPQAIIQEFYYCLSFVKWIIYIAGGLFVLLIVRKLYLLGEKLFTKKTVVVEPMTSDKKNN